MCTQECGVLCRSFTHKSHRKRELWCAHAITANARAGVHRTSTVRSVVPASTSRTPTHRSVEKCCDGSTLRYARKRQCLFCTTSSFFKISIVITIAIIPSCNGENTKTRNTRGSPDRQNRLRKSVADGNHGLRHIQHGVPHAYAQTRTLVARQCEPRPSLRTVPRGRSAMFARTSRQRDATASAERRKQPEQPARSPVPTMLAVVARTHGSKSPAGLFECFCLSAKF